MESQKNIDNTVPGLSSETYSGWLTHWSESFATKDTKDVLAELKYILDNKYSFSQYMVHGGSNFALTAGANA